MTSTLMHSTVNGTKEFAALDPSKIAAIKGINQLALIKHFDNLQLAIGLITVFAAILTGKAKRSEVTVFVWESNGLFYTIYESQR